MARILHHIFRGSHLFFCFLFFGPAYDTFSKAWIILFRACVFFFCDLYYIFPPAFRCPFVACIRFNGLIIPFAWLPKPIFSLLRSMTFFVAWTINTFSWLALYHTIPFLILPINASSFFALYFPRLSVYERSFFHCLPSTVHLFYGLPCTFFVALCTATIPYIRAAGAKEVRSAYLRLALCLHPDKANRTARQAIALQEEQVKQTINQSTNRFVRQLVSHLFDQSTNQSLESGK